jgi:large subunit ribosomal protein L11
VAQTLSLCTLQPVQTKSLDHQKSDAPAWWEVGASWPKRSQSNSRFSRREGAPRPPPHWGPQQFNEKTRELNGKVVGCIVTVYQDRTFDLQIKTSPAAELIKSAAKLEKGSGEPNTNKVGSITKAQIRQMATEKMADLNAGSVEAAMRMIEGTARSMGVTVAEGGA